MTDMLKNCQLCPRACGADRTKEPRSLRCRHRNRSYTRIASYVGGAADFGYKMARARCFSLIARSAVCSAKTARSAAERPRDRTLRQMHWRKPFSLWRKKGAHNINLVTGAHYVPQIIEALQIARKQGLSLPVVYNSSGYEQVETLQLLDGHIDIYLPDYKYYSSYYAGLYSHAEDYREFAVPAIDEMVRQTGAPQFDKNGLLKRGTVIRHLMLPGLAGDTAQVLRDIASRWGDSVLVSLMRQYTPFDMQDYPELDRTITAEEYADACTLFGELGLGGFFQQDESISESFIPAFDGTGLEEN